MSESPLVSICIPCYNYAHYIGNAIASVLEQTHQNVQLIVVDNGSTDNSFEEISRFSDPRLEVYRIEENKGPVPAWAMGLELSKGEWFGLLCADDYFSKDKLRRQIEWLQEHPEISALATYVNQVNQDGIQTEGYCWMEEQVNRPFDFDDYSVWHWTHHFCIPTALYKTDLCRKAGTPTPGLCGVSDWDFHVRLMRKGVRFAVLPERLTNYRWHDKNASHRGSDTAAIEWTYSYATQFVPLLQERGHLAEMKEAVRYFFERFHLPLQTEAERTRMLLCLAALSSPSYVREKYPTYHEFAKEGEHEELLKNFAHWEGPADGSSYSLESSAGFYSCLGLLSWVKDIAPLYKEQGLRLERVIEEKERVKERLAKMTEKRDQLQKKYDDLRGSSAKQPGLLKRIERKIRQTIRPNS